MTAEQLPFLLQRHNNRQLFSDYYLNEQLPKLAAWQSLVAEAQPIMHGIARLLDAFNQNSNEAQTERNLIQPVIDLLGHSYLVQGSIRAPGGTKKPDYLFYRNEDDRKAHAGITLADEQLAGHALAVGDAKNWDRNLDVALKRGGDPFSNKNPSYQIAFYIQHTGLEWGILTNGRKWRLYHNDSAHKLDRYYEVDLPDLIRSESVEDFLYFYAFFRREAFNDGPVSLNNILQASEDYALGIGDSLKKQAFDAIRHLSQGFLDHSPNTLETDPETLKSIYDNSLIILYRLLFIFYAEARGLLPVGESEIYRRTYSLQAMTREIAKEKQHGTRFLPDSTRTWSALRDLFRIINEGSPPLSVATFNGGLFDPEQHPFLEHYHVGDAHLREAIDILARVEGEFVDYRDLAEQHLGTVYEGLLEFHVQEISPEDGWRIDIFNDKGERKATGSYYTPNYIVRYIVEQTVGPVLEAAIEGKKRDQEKIDAILDVNVLDPAMGSGYFLVETTEFIARFLVDHIEEVDAGPDEEPDVAYWKRRVVQSCIYGVDLNPLAVDLAKLSLWLSTVAKDQPLSFLDHHLRTGNSLIGARVADLDSPEPPAVKRKKTTKKKKETQAAEAGQMTMLEDTAFQRALGSAVDSMWLIQTRDATTVTDVKDQERIYEDVRRELVRQYEGMADLVTAAKFGVEIPQEFWQPMLDYTANRSAVLPPRAEELLAEIRELSEQEHFFHWELEFPEVFFDRHGQWRKEQAGFDAVVGNPPYLRQERLKRYKPYFQWKFQSFSSSSDIYIYFYEQGLELVQSDGRLGYISSGTFARGNFAKPFRAYLPKHAQLETIIDFGENQPFKGAEMVRPSIVILRRGFQLQDFRGLFIDGMTPQSLHSAISNTGYVGSPDVMNESEWVFQAAEVTELRKKVLSVGRSLSKDIHGAFAYGVKTGLNDVFVVDSRTKDRLISEDISSAQIIKPLVRGEDLRPWYQEWEDQWLIFTRRGIDINLYPAVRRYLEEYQSRLQPKPPNWPSNPDWTGRKTGDYQWYEIQDSVDYYRAFERPKILWPDISKLPRFSWDDTGTYLTNTGYVIPDQHPSLLAILQSRVLWFAISQKAQPLRLRGGLWQFRLIRQFMEELPIPELSEADQEYLSDIALRVTDLAKTRYALHERVRNRVLTDLAPPDNQKLNQKLTRWWELDFPAFREQVKRHLKQEIPVAERDQWQDWLIAQRAEHDRLTADIIRLETDLNNHVYALFDLTEDEIALIEEITKYEYGEV